MARKGIYVNGKEIVARYVGDKLVWQKKPALPIQARKIVFENVRSRLHSTFISFDDSDYLHDFRGKLNGKYVLKISINGGQPIDIEPQSQQLEVIINMYINNISDRLKKYCIDNGLTYEYNPVNITFYLKE